MKKKLTYRQQTFLDQFLGIYREQNQSVHYSQVAERLGIGKVSAYEMLRLLEERGLVQAEYQVNPEPHSPGRSAVLFFPTPQAFQWSDTASVDSAEWRDWVLLKEQILQQLRESKSGGAAELLANIFARIPKRYSPLLFATELTTAVILILSTIQDSPEIQLLLERLKQVGLPKKMNLGVMSGIAMLLSVMERANRRYTAVLAAHISRYEETLSQLNQESRRRLGEFTREAVQILSQREKIIPG